MPGAYRDRLNVSVNEQELFDTIVKRYDGAFRYRDIKDDFDLERYASQFQPIGYFAGLVRDGFFRDILGQRIEEYEDGIPEDALAEDPALAEDVEALEDRGLVAEEEDEYRWTEKGELMADAGGLYVLSEKADHLLERNR